MRKTLERAAAAAAIAALAAGACKRERRAAEETAEAEEASILFFVELPSSHDLGDAARDLIDAFQPGASALAAGMLTGKLAEVVGADALDGANLERPLWLVQGDPNEFVHASALVVHVDDAEALEAGVGDAAVEIRDELAVIGSKDTVAAIAPYAESVLAKREAPEAPRLVAFPQALIDGYRAQVEQARQAAEAQLAASGQEMGPLLDIYFDGFVAAAEQTARAELEILGGDVPGILLTLDPVAETTLAGFIQVQAPSEFALVDALPKVSHRQFLLAGNLLLGPLGQPLMELGTQLMKTVMPEVDEELAEEFTAQFEGGFAFHGGAFPADPQIAAAFAIKDADTARSLFVRQMEQFAEAGGRMDLFGVEQSVEFHDAAFTHGDVPVMRQRTITEAVPGITEVPEESITYGATVDRLMVHSMGDDAEARIREMIDIAGGEREGYALTETFAEMLAESKRRNESAVMAFDPSADAAGDDRIRAVALGLAFPDGTMQLRVGLGLNAP